MNTAQLRVKETRTPELKPAQLEDIAYGRPYYSMAELQAATKLPQSRLERLFAIPPFYLRDKPAHKTIMLEPVHGRYIVPARTEFEEDPLPEADFEVVHAPSAHFNWRVIEARDFENVQASLDLKVAFGGQVHPVLRDVQGIERYLIPGSLDLWFRREIAEDRCLAIIRELGLIVADARPQVGYYRVQLANRPPDRNVTRAVLDVIEGANKLDEVAFAEPDQVGFEDFGPERSVVAGDLEEFEAADLFWNHNAIELAAAHEITTGSDKVTIIIIDSGARMSHPDLAPAFRPDWATLDLNFDLGVPESELSPNELIQSHGTRVCSVVGGRGGEEARQARGVAPGCHILPLKIPGQSGGPATPGYGLRAAAIFQALTYLKPDERAVLNLSWKTNGEHIGIREALVEAQNRGAAIVTSAGNYASGVSTRPDEIHYPSAHAYLDPKIKGLCSVAAVGFGDHKATYSYYGRQSITVAAPGGELGGVGIGVYTSSTPEDYVFTAGTSFAAPHVAGLIALLFSLKPSLTAEEAVQIIRDTADSINSANPMYAGMMGAGRINARAALQKVKGDGESPTSTPPPPPLHFDEMGRLKINLATFEELIVLPLAGPWRASRLLEYRDAHGPFSSIWGLALTRAFDSWTIRQLEPLITV
jgi:DNA uptake protein ComE-like DNA-binding protein